MSPLLRRRLVLIGLAVVILGFSAHAAHYGAYIDDDAGITFGYAKSWVAGRGLSVNPADPPVEGYSNPSWMFLLALTMRLGLFHWTWTPKLLGWLFGAITLGFAARLAAQLSGRRLEAVHLLAPALLALNGSFVVWAVSGLENGLYGALVLGVLSVWLARRTNPPAWLGIFLTALAITRPEAVGYAGLVALDALVGAAWHRNRRANIARFLGVSLALFVLYVAWHLATFADPLPNTYYAKIDGEGASAADRVTMLSSSGWRYLFGGFGNWHLGWTVIAALGLLLRPARQERGVPLAFGMAAWSVSFVVSSGGDWMMEYRFLSPGFALFSVLAAGGLVAARDALAGSGFGWRAGRFPAAPLAAVTAVSAVMLATWAALPLPARAARIVSVPTMPLENTRRAADIFMEFADRLGVALPVVVQGAMGGPALESDGRVVWIDAFGLTDRTVAHCFHERCPVETLWQYALVERKADFLDFPPSMSRRWRITEAPGWKDDFVPLRSANGGVGVYVRRSRLDAPAGAGSPDAEPVRSGNVLVHGFELLAATGDESARLQVDFEVAEAGIPACFVRDAGGKPTRLPLLEFISSKALRPGTLYRDRPPLPEGLSAPTLVPG